MNSPITQILAALLLLLSAVKMAMLATRPRAWFGVARWIYRHPEITSRVALMSAALVLWLLVRSGLDIVEILAVCLFMSLLMIAGLAPYAPRLLDWIESQDLRQLTREQGGYVLAWLALLLWGAFILLA
jgi:hypothetical protein